MTSLTHKTTTLIPYTSEHDEKTVLWLNNPDVYLHFGLTKRIELESHRKWIESQQNFYLWAIYEDKSVHRGNVSLQHYPAHHHAYFQMYIGDTSVRGKGLGFSALICTIKFAFEELKINRLWLHVFPENQHAIYIYEKAGFVYEGIEREAHFSDGNFRDQLRFSLLCREWQEKQETFL